MKAARVWVYVKVYVHDRPEMLDWLVIAALPAVRAQLAGARWFFLRYFDATGVHLRVRFEVPAADRERTLELLTRELTLPYADLDRAGFDGFDWFAPRLRPVRGLNATTTLVVPAEYEPEYATYGWAEMPIAEDLFHRSSDLAAAELGERRTAGAAYDKLAALEYMQAVSDAFVAVRDEAAFWHGYRDFWLGSDPAVAGALRRAIERNAARVAPALRDRSIERSAAWRAALADAARRYAGRAGELAVRQFVHLTNNRLGITTIEESYLAQLVLSVRCAA